MNFPLNTALVASHKFWYIVFLFSLISKYFLISLWLLLWAISCLYMRCLLSKYLLIFHFSFCYQFLASVHCGQRKYSDDFNLLKFIQICFVALLNVVILEGVPSPRAGPRDCPLCYLSLCVIAPGDSSIACRPGYVKEEVRGGLYQFDLSIRMLHNKQPQKSDAHNNERWFCSWVCSWGLADVGWAHWRWLWSRWLSPSSWNRQAAPEYSHGDGRGARRQIEMQKIKHNITSSHSIDQRKSHGKKSRTGKYVPPGGVKGAAKSLGERCGIGRSFSFWPRARQCLVT